MKKAMLWSLCCVLTLSMAACGNTPAKSQQEDSSPVSESTTTQTKADAPYTLSVVQEGKLSASQVMGFSDDRLILYGDKKCTLADYDGKPIGSDSYDLIYPFENGNAVAMQGKNYVTIDKDGKVVGKAKAPQNTREKYGVEKKNEKGEEVSLFGVQDENGKRLTEPLFGFIASVDEEYNYATLADGSPVMISPDGKVLVHLPKGCKGAYKYDSCIVCQMSDSVYQIADVSGKMGNSNTFDAIGSFMDGKAPAVKDGKLGLISDKGEFLSDFTVPVGEADAPAVPYLYKDRIACVKDGKLLLADIKAA